jgi:hypothetical protein
VFVSRSAAFLHFPAVPGESLLHHLEGEKALAGAQKVTSYIFAASQTRPREDKK